MTTPENKMENTSLYGKPPGYHSYLLRFWEERSDQSPLTVWRFSLEDPLTDRRYGFASLEALVGWIQACIDTHPDSKQIEKQP